MIFILGICTTLFIASVVGIRWWLEGVCDALNKSLKSEDTSE